MTEVTKRHESVSPIEGIKYCIMTFIGYQAFFTVFFVRVWSWPGSNLRLNHWITFIANKMCFMLVFKWNFCLTINQRKAEINSSNDMSYIGPQFVHNSPSIVFLVSRYFSGFSLQSPVDDESYKVPLIGFEIVICRIVRNIAPFQSIHIHQFSHWQLVVRALPR